MMTDADFKPVFGEPVPASAPAPRVRVLNRSQLMMLYVDIERLIPDDHPAKAIWELVGTLDLSPFYEKVKALEGRAGQDELPLFLRLLLQLRPFRGVGRLRESSGSERQRERNTESHGLRIPQTGAHRRCPFQVVCRVCRKVEY